jgi:hypothetical protein
MALRVAAVVLGALAAAGCATSNDRDRAAELVGRPQTQGTRVEMPPHPLECVPYARARSGLMLFGDAGTWWDKADGRYVKSAKPQRGSVLTGYAGPGRGHVGVVSAVISQREIRLDHANWLGDGAIYIGDPVVDVSSDNDWSEVRVWNPRTDAWGLKTYLVEGFIGPDQLQDSDRIAAD